MEQREHWSYKSEENREENEKFKKGKTDNVVNKDSATSDLVDSPFKIDFNKNSPASNFDFSKIVLKCIHYTLHMIIIQC